jgi:hypothetical protein
MKVGFLILALTVCSWATLIPTPLFTDPEPVQRIGWEITNEHLDAYLFSQCYGISFM